ncbi:hypothetical protein, partial [Streptococcus suis]|uniref:hypothetical protein n=1 Tax=Streptococcus suis TaxID=1307 RepID=UPI003795DB61
RSNNENKKAVYKEKTPQLFFRIEHRISDKKERNVVKKQFHAENAIQKRGGRGIENLHCSKPDKQQQWHKKRRAK